MEVDGEPIDISSDPNAGKAVFDTGTTANILADPVYERVLETLFANGCYSNCINSPTRICCPCTQQFMNKLPNITAYTRGLKIVMTPDFYMFPDPRNKVMFSWYFNVFMSFRHSALLLLKVQGS